MCAIGPIQAATKSGMGSLILQVNAEELREIVLDDDASALEEVRMYAQALGKRKDSVYPELYHIGEDIATGVVL